MLKVALNVSKKWLEFSDGLTELNSNDVMWQRLRVELSEPLATKESLWVKYTNKKYGEHSHDILLAEGEKAAETDIPEAVIKIAGEWSLQLLIRQYSTTDPAKYTQKGSNIVTFTVVDGLPVDGNGNPVTNATIAALYEEAKAKIKTSVFELEVLSTDSVWEEVNGKWQVRIPQTTHNFQKIQSIVVEKKTETDMYENMIYSYKRYLSGSVSVIVDYKIDMRIVIKGTNGSASDSGDSSTENTESTESTENTITFTLNKIDGTTENFTFRYTSGMTWRQLAINYPNYLFGYGYGPVSESTANAAVLFAEAVDESGVQGEQYWISRSEKQIVALDDVIVGDEYLVARTIGTM